jgi:hypothetical protein
MDGVVGQTSGGSILVSCHKTEEQNCVRLTTMNHLLKEHVRASLLALTKKILQSHFPTQAVILHHEFKRILWILQAGATLNN